MKKVLVVIPVINLWEQYVESCIKSIRSEKNNVSILVIDNGSVDVTKQKCRELSEQRDDFFLIENEKNVGVSGAWNQGIKYGLEKGFDYILVSNSDVIYHKECIDTMVKEMSENDKFRLITAHNVREEVDIADMDYVDELKKERSISKHPDFASFMIDKKTIDLVGWFDEGFFPAFHEDNDYHRRLVIECGEDSAVSSTQCMFYHYGSRTWNQDHQGMRDSARFQLTQDFYVKKWGGYPGKEVFNKPYNADNRDIKFTNQDSIKEGAGSLSPCVK